jgi:cyanophycinase-like exopeptidase
MGNRMELTVQDRLSIQDLCARACHTIDFNDPDGYASLYAPDGAFQRRAAASAGGEVIFRHEGHDQLRMFATNVTSMRKGLARHWTANIAIRPTEAGAEATSYTMLVSNDPETRQVGISIAGVYQDVFQKTGAGWLFTSRTVVDDM